MPRSTASGLAPTRTPPSAAQGLVVPDGQASRSAESLSPNQFKAVFRQHPAGVAVVTLRHRERLVGFTATSVISVSAEPPVLAFSVAGGSSSWLPLTESETVVINFLSADQVDLSARFATRGIDRFACGGWSLLESGEPVLDGSLRWLRAEIIQRTAVGSSHLVCLRALSSSAAGAPAAPGSGPLPPLVYHDRVYHRLGSASAL